jgi:hypothetical protein
MLAERRFPATDSVVKTSAGLLAIQQPVRTLFERFGASASAFAGLADLR